MNEVQKEKPIRELLQDITSSGDGSRVAPHGLVRPKVVDRIVFVSSLVSLLLIVVAVLAMIWDFAEPVFALQCISSIVVLQCALLVFRAINDRFE
jgi:hypothetical protein